MKIKFPKIPKIPRPPKILLSVTTAVGSLVSRKYGFDFRVESAPEEFGVAGAGAGGRRFVKWLLESPQPQNDRFER